MEIERISQSQSWAGSKWSALHAAALLGDRKWAEALITCGIDPDVRDCTGRAPLEWAQAMGHQHIVVLLLGHGEKIIQYKAEA